MLVEFSWAFESSTYQGIPDDEDNLSAQTEKVLSSSVSSSTDSGVDEGWTAVVMIKAGKTGVETMSKG